MGGGGGGGSVVEAAFPGGGGIEIGGEVCILPPGGGGGVNGTFSGGIALLELGVAGEDESRPGETEPTGPGGGGVAAEAVWLWEPGRTAAVESFMLGLVFPSRLRTSAKDLFSDVSNGPEAS